MKYTLALLTTLTLVSAHVQRDNPHDRLLHKRAPASSSSSAEHASSHAAANPPASSQSKPASAAPSTASKTAAPAASSQPVGGAGGYSYTLPNPSVSLLATNPTAIPLASITPESGPNSQPTHAVATPAVPGQTPFAGAPALPNAAILDPKNYPTLDMIPPTNSPEVQGWIKEVQNSGIPIPSIKATQPGGCPSNPDVVANTSVCWWTCGQCTRSTDITTCPDKLTWGLTYDDGPSPYTPDLINYLGEKNLKATFFIVGSRAISYPSILQATYMQQHQVAVHTWSHPPLTTLTTEQIIAELGWSRKIIKDVTGVTPLYWRPPYGDIDDRVRAIGTAMKMTPVMWTGTSSLLFDTDDFGVKGALSTPGGVLENWKEILGNASTLNTGFIVLEHDLFEQAVDLATGYILPDALASTNPKLTIKPVVACQNQPQSNAYLETNNNQSNPIATVAPSAASTTLQPGSTSTHSGAAGHITPSTLNLIPTFVAIALTFIGAAVVYS